MNRLANTSCAAAIVAAFVPAPVLAGDITAEWANVTPPPAPELKQVTVDPKTTALLVLDFGKNNCGVRPRCLANVPNVKKLIDEARTHNIGRLYPPWSGTQRGRARGPEPRATARRVPDPGFRGRR
jgi:hypothetical protein